MLLHKKKLFIHNLKKFSAPYPTKFTTGVHKEKGGNCWYGTAFRLITVGKYFYNVIVEKTVKRAWNNGKK
ncbi:MAG: hypothetical protein JWQ96_1553 [Segetibacter sp.]|nr:hypothetical protein [Segetibacter sp.]